jgi:hypothetical protein
MQKNYLRPYFAAAVTILMLASPTYAQSLNNEPAPSSTETPTPPSPPTSPPAPVEQPSVTQPQEPATLPPAGQDAPAVILQEKAEVAYLVCYREKRFLGAALNTSVHVDGVEIADMDNGCYIIVKVKPGEHKVYADAEKDALTVKVDAGKSYYFRMELAMGLWKGHGRLKEVDLATGEKEFKEWKLDFAPDIRQPDMVIKEL